MSDMNSDLISELLRDHERVAALFVRLDEVTPTEAGEVFWELTNELKRHETTEEEVVYPEVRRLVPNGERLANARLKEQAKAEELLGQMEKAGPGDKRFPALLVRLRKAVLQHAEKEENLIFGPLARALDADRRAWFGRRYVDAKAAAPSHPHPNQPNTPLAAAALRPVTAAADMARDAMHTVLG